MPTTELTDEFGFERPAEGQYFLIIDAVDAHPTDKNKVPLDCGSVCFQVISGTVEGQKGRRFWDKFWNPGSKTDADNSEKPDMSVRRQTELVISTGIAASSQRKTTISWEWEDLIGKVLCAAVGPNSKDGKYSGIQYDNMWHMASDKAKHIPKLKVPVELAEGGNKYTLATDGKTVVAKSAQTASTKPTGNGSPKPAAPAQQPEPVAAGVSDDDLDLDSL